MTEPTPRTGDPVVDEALADLDAADARDLDAQIAAAERVQDALRARLADLEA